jgi:hypothetical protein
MYNWDLNYLTHWLQLYVLTLYDDRRPEDDQDWSKHVAYVLTVAENTYNKSRVEGIYFL